jgi:sulfite reductase (NADPH) hemoprotein beta-component
LGWQAQTNGKWFLGLFVENGRIKDAPGYELKTGLRRVIEQFQPEVRLTASQNLLLVNIPAGQREGIEQLLGEHGVQAGNPLSRTRLAAMACPALPTCGLALAESERVSPDLLGGVEGLLAELGLGQEELIIRMTGCPNGCTRPYMAELAFVGKAPQKYQIYLGGNEPSTRLNRLYKDSVKWDELLPEVRALLTRYLRERTPGERFGDFCARVVWPELPSLAK